MQYPSVNKNSKVYNADDSQFVGLATIVLPKVTFEKNDIKGMGVAGSLNLPVAGNVQPMTTTLTFHTNTLQALNLFTGATARIRCISALQVYDTSTGKFDEIGEEVIMNVASDVGDLGRREMSTKAEVSYEYSVVSFSLSFNDKVYWHIDPLNNICVVNGVDLNERTRAIIG
jgi:P2 family phage contractile tail tube protein